jgi:hypothetical protein
MSSKMTLDGDLLVSLLKGSPAWRIINNALKVTQECYQRVGLLLKQLPDVAALVRNSSSLIPVDVVFLVLSLAKCWLADNCFLDSRTSRSSLFSMS